MVWQVQETLKLINLYRDAPELWNPDHGDYRNRNIRRATLTKLAEEMNTTCVEIERKLRGIRTQFAREHVREISGQKSIWFGYQPLSFLAKERKCLFVDESQNFQEQWSELEDIDEIELITPEENCVRSVTSEEKMRIIDSENFRTNFAVKRTSDTEKALGKKSKNSSAESYQQTCSNEDEYITFANCVVHKLRSINSARARSIAQYYINWVLFQAEMTNYEEDFEFDCPKEFNLFRRIKNKD